MIHAEDLLRLVGELAARVGPDTELRWKRDSYWHPDDEANLALQRRRTRKIARSRRFWNGWF